MFAVTTHYPHQTPSPPPDIGDPHRPAPPLQYPHNSYPSLPTSSTNASAPRSVPPPQDRGLKEFPHAVVQKVKPVVVQKARTALEMILGLEKFDEERDGDFPRWVVRSFSRTSDFYGIAYAEDWERERFSTRERAFVILHTLLVALFASAVVDTNLRCYRRQRGLSMVFEYILAGILQPVFKFFLLTWFIKYIFEQSIEQGTRLKTMASKAAHATAAAIMVITGLIAVSALFYKPEVRKPCSEYQWRGANAMVIAYMATNWLFGETIIAFLYTAVLLWVYNKRWNAWRTDAQKAKVGLQEAKEKIKAGKGGKGWGGGGMDPVVLAQVGTAGPSLAVGGGGGLPGLDPGLAAPSLASAGGPVPPLGASGADQALGSVRPGAPQKPPPPLVQSLSVNHAASFRPSSVGPAQFSSVRMA